MNAADTFWSSTDFPWTCLRDRRRTRTLGAVVEAVVRPGDSVLDAGSGTGILALYAARAGARQVWAAEADPVLCRYLRQTVAANGYDDVITVVEGDVHTLAVPPVDVAVLELVETGLVDEALVSAYNALLGTGTLDARTRCLPDAYATSVQPVRVEGRVDGFTVVALRHDWPYFDDDPHTWGEWPVEPVADAVEVWSGRFAGVPVPTEVRARVEVPEEVEANGLRLTGVLGLPDGTRAGAFPSLNGAKVLPLPPRPAGATAVTMGWTLSAGWAGLTLDWA